MPSEAEQPHCDDATDGVPIPAALCPETLTGLERTEPKAVAAGARAVIVSLRHVIGQAGLGRGLKALVLSISPTVSTARVAPGPIQTRTGRSRSSARMGQRQSRGRPTAAG